MNFSSAIHELTQNLNRFYEEEEIKVIGAMLWEHVTGARFPAAHSSLAESEINLWKTLSHELYKGTPIQYVIGHAWFQGIQFLVNEHVLIPRPETEQLVQLIINHFKNKEGALMMDVGSGSGCIPISLAYHLKKGSFHGLDVSEPALKLAKINAQKIGVAVQWHHLNFLDKSSWNQLPVPDLLVSNPPYIPQAEAAQLNIPVREFEPELALFVPDNNPLIFYVALADYAKEMMQPGSNLIAEFHSPLAPLLSQLYQLYNFSSVEIVKDWYGRDRFVMVCL